MENQDVYFIDGVRTPFGKAGEKGAYWKTRADDLVVKAMIGLLERNPEVPAEQIDDVAIAAATQIGDQGLQIGRSASILAGLPQSVPGYSIDRWCAGAMTSVTTAGSAIGVGAYDVALAGGVEHMGHHPMGEGADPNPRFLAEKLVDPSAMNMGITAEKIHDRFPHLTKERSDAYAVASQHKAAKAYQDGKIQKDLIPVSAASEQGWSLVTQDELLRPESSMEGMQGLKTPFRPHGKVTAGNASPLTDGATMSLIAGERAVKKLGLKPKMKMLSFAFAGVEPELMGIGPIPSTEKALAKAGLTLDDIGLIEINEAFAMVTMLAMKAHGLDHSKVNVHGGACAQGHPIGSTGSRIIVTLMHAMHHYGKERGVAALCIGGGEATAVAIEKC